VWYNAEDKKLGNRVSMLELDFRIVKMVNDHMILKSMSSRRSGALGWCNF
jgi:hypothetical protein